MDERIARLAAVESDTGRGRVTDTLIYLVKEARDQVGVVGIVGSVVLLYVGSYFLLTAVFGAASSVIGGTVGFLAGLAALAYTSWVGFTAYEESTDREQARIIRSRPSIDTIEESFDLLTSPDPEAREHAAECVQGVTALGPQKVVSILGASAEDVVSYLIPRLDSEQEAVRASIASAIAFFARDYPAAVVPHRETLLSRVTADDISPEVRGELAMTVGYLSLTRGSETETLETVGFELADHSNSRVRIGACYMLAGAQTDRARERIRHIAENDPDTEVRNHAEELY
jgi:hypothetical protein